MTRQATPFAVGKVLADAIADHVLDLGPVQASGALQCDRATAAAWRDSRDPFLPHCYAVGASLVATPERIMPKLNALLFGSALGHAEDVDSDVMNACATLGAFFTEAAKAMGNKHCDLIEAPRLLASAMQAQPILAKVIADVTDQITRRAP